MYTIGYVSRVKGDLLLLRCSGRNLQRGRFAVGYCMIVRTRDDSLLPPRYSCCTTHFPTTILADTCCDAVVGTSSVEFAVGYWVIVRTRDDYYLLNLGHLSLISLQNGNSQCKYIVHGDYGGHLALSTKDSRCELTV